jgi:hypothetical protein
MLIFVSCFIIPFVVVIHQQCYYINMSMLRFVSSSISKREYTIFCFDLIEHSPILIYLCIYNIYLYPFITSISIFLCIYASMLLSIYIYKGPGPGSYQPIMSMGKQVLSNKSGTVSLPLYVYSLSLHTSVYLSITFDVIDVMID